MYDAQPDPYCYPETSVLKNKLDLRTADELEAFEADAITQRGDEPLPDGDLSPLNCEPSTDTCFRMFPTGPVNTAPSGSRIAARSATPKT
ncbi:hypothetical protein ABVK49_01850 [Mesorhizobium sp. WSM2239]|uniref:Uncharacterized protein n=1 Tax=Mesorhizobium sp. WSM2239 TaxID=3228852 RepID=A0AAU8D8P0_9HYPH